MNKINKIPESELAIMKVLWESDRALVAGGITEKLLDKDWKPSTLLTLIARLLKKGFIKSQKDGRYFSYSPLVKENDYLELEAKSILEKLYDNSIKKFITALYESDGVNGKDLDELSEWLKDRR